MPSDLSKSPPISLSSGAGPGTAPALPVQQQQHQACLTIQGDNMAVRDGLGQLMAMGPLAGLSEDIRGTVEIVLAEALNNVVEHAYPNTPGPILVGIDHLPPVLRVSVYDLGLPMPDGQLPKGELKPMVEGEELPEGGFGWFLIRTLTMDLEYERDGSFNKLRFAVPAQ